jgi:hypothetical protein
MENKNVRVQIHTTVSYLNIMDLDKMVDWCVATAHDWRAYRLTNFETYFPHINVVTWPDYLAINNMPDSIKSQSVKIINDIYDKYCNLPGIESWEKEKLDSIKSLIGIIESERSDELWDKFLEVTRQSDDFRKIDIKDYISWTKDYL